MKIALFVLLAASVALAAPVDESSAKEKRGLALGFGYHHAPLLTHSTHYVAPAVVHHAPVYHAPIYHAPLVAHHPVSYHLPAYHSYHHFK